MIKIFLADDHTIVRSGLKNILAKEAEFELVGEAASGGEVLERLRYLTPTLLLTDLTMPGMSGMELIERVRISHPKLQLLVLTMCNDAAMAMRILKAGAHGYITKDCSPKELISAVLKVANGGRFIDPILSDQMLFDTRYQEARHNTLSNRELDLMRMLFQGMRVNEIANQLSISTKTVSAHKCNMMKKMQLRNMSELVLYAAQYELFSQNSLGNRPQ